MTKELTKERKEQIIDNYIQSIRQYLNVGLCEGQANGSFGEDLMRHFDIIAKCFKETTLIEHDLGLDLITLFKALKNGVWFKPRKSKTISFYGVVRFWKGSLEIREKLYNKYVGGSSKRIIQFQYYGKTWALTKNELTKEEK